jgi:hypothetical protein
MHSQTSEVVIMPQFPIEQTTFKMKESRMHSFSGVVDDLLAHVPPGDFCSKPELLCTVSLSLMPV